MKKLILLASLSVAALTNTASADVKCSPDIKVTYEGGHGTSIKVVAFEYSVNGGGTWHREGVGNEVLTKNQAKTWRSQRLGSAAKGTKLDLRAVYRADTGRGFGGEQKGDIRNSGKQCENNVSYSLLVN